MNETGYGENGCMLFRVCVCVEKVRALYEEEGEGDMLQCMMQLGMKVMTSDVRSENIRAMGDSYGVAA
jgi:hypothetical protein